MNLFHNPDCTCDVRASLTAALANQRPERCALHEPDLIAADQAADDAADLDRQLRLRAGARDALDEITAARAAKQAADERAQALDALAQRDPLLAAVTRATGAALPLNAPLDAYPALSGIADAGGNDGRPLDAA